MYLISWMQLFFWNVFLFLDHFIPFRAMGRVLEPLPAAHGQRLGTPQWGARSSKTLCEHLGVLYLAKGYLGSALKRYCKLPLPSLVNTGAWTHNPPLLSPLQIVTTNLFELFMKKYNKNYDNSPYKCSLLVLFPPFYAFTIKHRHLDFF